MALLGDNSLHTGALKNDEVLDTRDRDSIGELRVGYVSSLVVSLIMLGVGWYGLSRNAPGSGSAYTAYSAVFTIGAIAACAALFLAEFDLLIRDFLSGDYQAVVKAFRTRDRRGLAVPSGKTQEGLRSARDLSAVFTQQPEDVLLALLSCDKAANDLIQKCQTELGWGPGATADLLLNNPSCTTLTKVRFACGSSDNRRIAAAQALPEDLWPRAVRSLAISQHREARLAAVECVHLPRKMAMLICRDDQDSAVSEAAWNRVHQSLSTKEHRWLLGSRHAAIRLRIAQSRTLTHGQLLRLCRLDVDRSVRDAAWDMLKGKLTDSEAMKLSFSKHADVRLHAVKSSKLSRKRYLAMCKSDSDASVRQAAWSMLDRGLRPVDCARLARSPHTDIRAAVAGHARASRRILLRLVRDPDSSTRLKALPRIVSDATADELDMLARNRDLTVRKAAADHRNTRRETRLRLADDTSLDVRQVAMRRVRDLGSDDYLRLSWSSHQDVRLALVEDRNTPAEVMDRLLHDQDQQVRERAESRRRK